MAFPAMAGKHPFKAIVQEAFHGLCLFAPGVPADIAKGFQSLIFVCEMISRKKIFVSIQQHRMSARMARSRDHEKIAIQLDRVLPFEFPFDREVAGIGAMNDPLAAEMVPELLMVGNIVAMSQKH